jgi:hypothetical protein
MNQKFETIELKWKFVFNTQQELDLFGDLLMNLKRLKDKTNDDPDTNANSITTVSVGKN